MRVPVRPALHVSRVAALAVLCTLAAAVVSDPVDREPVPAELLVLDETRRTRTEAPGPDLVVPDLGGVVAAADEAFTKLVAGSAPPASPPLPAPQPRLDPPVSPQPAPVPAVPAAVVAPPPVPAPVPAPVAGPAPPVTVPPAVVPAGGPVESPVERARRIGAEATQTVAYDWAWTGFGVEFLPGEPGAVKRGATMARDGHILIWVRPEDDAADVASVLAHEVGHAVDVAAATVERRARYREIRGIGEGAWFGCSGCSDFATPAGDWAESFATWALQGTGAAGWRSQLGPPPDAAQLAALDEMFRVGH